VVVVGALFHIHPVPVAWKCITSWNRTVHVCRNVRTQSMPKADSRSIYRQTTAFPTKDMSEQAITSKRILFCSSTATWRHLAAKVGTSKGRGKQWNYPQALAQNAVCQSHTGHLTGLWFLPKLAQGLNTNYYYWNKPNRLICIQNTQWRSPSKGDADICRLTRNTSNLLTFRCTDIHGKMVISNFIHLSN
jgi:hypothetical protein